MATGTIIEVVMPQMGVSVSEGTIVKWLKAEGETIEADQPLLEISTDKVDTEVPSPGTGVVARILVHEGETVDVGAKLAEIAPEGAEPAAAAPEPRSRAGGCPGARHSRGGRRGRRALERGDAGACRAAYSCRAACSRRAAGTRPAGAGAASENGKSFVSPVVARIAAEHGVDVGADPGHGPGRPRDEEGHSCVHRRRYSGTCVDACDPRSPRPAVLTGTGCGCPTGARRICSLCSPTAGR